MKSTFDVNENERIGSTGFENKSETKGLKHFHVLGSQPGCMPMSNDVCLSYEQAKGCLEELVDNASDVPQDEITDLDKFDGSEDGEFYINEAGNYEYEMSECLERDCIKYALDHYELEAQEIEDTYGKEVLAELEREIEQENKGVSA